MIPDQWQKAKDLFNAALKCSPDERLRFVDENCNGDEAVRREVESLLANAEDAAVFLEQPAVGEVAEAIAGNNKKLRVSQSLSHYKILKLLGEGGMGEVYLAEDNRLERKVALKILPATFAQDTERMRRFVQEAKAASALNHPNILTIYETGETDNTNYIASEYVEGETLSERMKREPLNLKAALDVAVQIASALQAAHGAGIVHRDIKPDNVMIRPDGFVKLLDFGIAKLTEKKTEPIDAEAATEIKASTTPGMIIGTANYMSPEQALGKQIDARTDIFSFGVMLYQMLAGKLPFEGANVMETIGLILHKEPVPLSRHKPDIPHEIERIVGKALRKDCEERYQTAKDLLIDLKDVKQDLEFQNKLERTASPNREESKTQIISAATTDAAHTASSAEYITAEIKNHKLGFVALSVLLLAAIGLGYWFFFNHSLNTKQIESIAVMPFVNESGNADVEYLSDGMTETLISSLSQIPKLNVKARSSVFRYKGKETDAVTIGKQLNVQAIVHGTVVQRGQDLALHIELVDAQTENALWSADYKQPMTNLVSLQSEIARDVSQKLKIKLSGADEQKLTKNYTENSEAYQLYLKGQYEWNKHTLEDLQKGIEYFNQAIEKDPNYALAYFGLSASYGVLGNNYLPPREAFPKAKAYAAKALAIDDTLSEAHTVMAAVNLFYDWDWAEAEKHLKRARTLSPNDAGVSDIYGAYWDVMGQPDKALAESKRGQELDPLSLLMNTNLGIDFYYARQYDEAIAQLEKTVNLEPRYYNASLWLGQAYEKKKMYGQAIATYQKGLAQPERNPKLLASLGHAYALSGERGKANQALAELREMSKRRYISPYLFAVVYVGLGDKEQTFAWLEKAFQDRSFFLIWLKVEPIFDSLRSDSRFQDLLQRVGLQS